MKKSRTLFDNGLERAHKQFNASLNNFMAIVTGDERDSKMQSMKQLIDSIDRLRVFVADTDAPRWLTVIENTSRAALGDPSPSNMQQLGTQILINYDAIIKHVWPSEDDLEAIDLQSEVNVLYQSSNIQALFDDLVEKLRIVIETKEVEHSSALNSLQSLINLIKKNKKNPSSLSVLMSVTLSTVKNFVKIYPTKENSNPALASAMESLTKSLDELKTASNNFAQTAQDRIEASIKEDVPLIAPSEKLLIRLGYTKPSLGTDQPLEGTIES